MLINPINYGRRSFRPPFGLLTIASVFVERGIDVRWIDADALRNDKALVEKQILENLDVDLIATGGLHSAYLSVKEIFQFLADKNIAIPKLICSQATITKGGGSQKVIIVQVVVDVDKKGKTIQCSWEQI